jgi:hypothetical protein
MERYSFQRVKYTASHGYGISCAKVVVELTGRIAHLAVLGRVEEKA